MGVLPGLALHRPYDRLWPRLLQTNEPQFCVSHILISFNNHIRCLTLPTFRSYLAPKLYLDNLVLPYFFLHFFDISLVHS